MDKNVPVSLDVGGVLYTVPLPLLFNFSDTVLAKVFRGRPLNDNNNGPHFIDRDGSMFKYIIDYLYKKPIPLDTMLVRDVKQLRREFEYFGLRLLGDIPTVAYVCGGKRTPLTSGSLEFYDASLNKWVSVASLLTPRYAAQLCSIPTYKVMFAVGGSNQRVALSAVEKFDLVTQTWQEVSPMSVPRKRHGACVMGDYIYVAGGFGADNKELASVERYDMQRDVWSFVAPMPHAAAGAMLVVGADLLFIPSSFLTPFQYCVATNSWGRVSSMLESRMGCGVCSLDGKVYAIGGYGGPEGHMNSVEVYDPEKDSWKMIASMHECRAYPGCFALANRVYVAGGQAQAATGTAGVELASVECYDPALNEWSFVTSLTSARSHLAACVTCEQMDLVERRLNGPSVLERGLASAPRPPSLIVPYEDDEDASSFSEGSDLGEDGDGMDSLPPVWPSYYTPAPMAPQEVKRRRPVPPIASVHSSSARLLISMGDKARSNSLGPSSSCPSFPSSSPSPSTSFFTSFPSSLSSSSPPSSSCDPAVALLLNTKRPPPARAQTLPFPSQSWPPFAGTSFPLPNRSPASRQDLDEAEHRKVARR